MQQKKNPKKDLRHWSLIFFQIGLIVVLLVSWRLIEMKSYDKQKEDTSMTINLSNLEPDQIEVVQHPQTNTPPPPPPPKAPKKIKIVENDKDVDEDVVKSVEDIDEDKVQVTQDEAAQISDVQAAPAPEPAPVQEVSFKAIEDVPIFPGCGHFTDNKDRRSCMEKKIKKFVSRHFNAELGHELGLHGRIAIYTQFVVDEHGNITDVNARATNPALKKEAIRVVKMLPKMKPGKQRGKAVRVRYTLPIMFQVN